MAKPITDFRNRGNNGWGKKEHRATKHAPAYTHVMVLGVAGEPDPVTGVRPYENGKIRWEKVAV